MLSFLIVVKLEVDLPQIELCWIVLWVQLDCLQICIECFLVVLLYMLNFANDEMEVTFEQFKFLPEIRVFLDSCIWSPVFL